MIIYPNGSIVTREGEPNINFADLEWQSLVLVIDDNSELGQLLLNGAPFNPILSDGKVIDVLLLNKPNDVEGMEIQLIKNEQGKWEYIYVDVVEEINELELLREQIEELNRMLDILVGEDDE